MPRVEVNVFQAEATTTTIGPPQQERTLHVQVWCLEDHVQKETLGRSLHGDLSGPRSLGFILSVVKNHKCFQWGMVEVTQEIHVFKVCTGFISGDRLVESNSRSKEIQKTIAITQATDDGSLGLAGSRGLERHESSWSLFGGSWQLGYLWQIHGSDWLIGNCRFRPLGRKPLQGLLPGKVNGG